MSVCAYTCVCEEDASWIPQYLKESERLRLPFVVHFDRCSLSTKKLMREHRNCVSTSVQDDLSIEFTEMHKQAAFDRVVERGFRWAMAWDIDETYDADAGAKILRLPDADYIDVKWVNLWDDAEHIRIDGPFSGGHRVKFYDTKKWRWKFLHPTVNGASAVTASGERVPHSVPVCAKSDLVCLHHGMMTQAMRDMHKARWDRIYRKAVGRNPYGFWEYACDTKTYPPTVVEHSYR